MISWCHKVVITPHIPSYVTFINCHLMWPFHDHYHPLKKTSLYVETKKTYMCFHCHFVLFFILIWSSYYYHMFLYWCVFFTFCNILQSCAFHMIISCSIVKCSCVVVHVCTFTQFMYFLCFMVCIICFNNFFWAFIYVTSWLCLHLCLTSCCCATCFMLLCHLLYVCHL